MVCINTTRFGITVTAGVAGFINEFCHIITGENVYLVLNLYRGLPIG